MSSKTVFDSNIWIGYFNRDDVHHKAAVDLITHSGEQDIYIPEYVVLESVSILKMRQSEKAAKLCLDVFLHTSNIHIIPSGDLFTKTINLFQTLLDKSVSFDFHIALSFQMLNYNINIVPKLIDFFKFSYNSN